MPEYQPVKGELEDLAVIKECPPYLKSEGGGIKDFSFMSPVFTWVCHIHTAHIWKAGTGTDLRTWRT